MTRQPRQLYGALLSIGLILTGCASPPKTPELQPGQGSEGEIVAEALAADRSKVVVRAPESACWHVSEFDTSGTRLATVSACGDTTTLAVQRTFGVLVGRSPCTYEALVTADGIANAEPEKVVTKRGFFILPKSSMYLLAKELTVTCIDQNGEAGNRASTKVSS